MSPRTQTDPKINLAVGVKDMQEREQAIDGPLHLHPYGEEGASNLNGCDLLKTLKVLWVKLPPKHPFMKDTTIFYLGTARHIDDQTKLTEYFKDHPTYVYIAEPYTEFVIVPGYVCVTPMDEVVAKRDPPPTIQKQKEFAPGRIETINIMSPDAQIVKLGDIKTQGNYGFKKTWQNGLSKGYQFQGMLELAATNMDKITFRCIHKEKGVVITIDLFWDEKVWAELQAKTAQYVEFRDRIKALLGDKQVNYEDIKATLMSEVKRENLKCYQDPSGIGWYSCPLAKVHTEKNRDGLDVLKLDEHCEFVKKFILEDYLTLFPVGTWRKFGSKGVKILDNNVVFKDGSVRIKFISRGDLTKLETKIASEEKKFVKYEEKLLKFKEDHDTWVEYKKEKPKGRKKEPKPPEKVELKSASEIKLEFEESGQIVFMTPVEAFVKLKEFPPDPVWPSNQGPVKWLDYLPKGACGRCVHFDDQIFTDSQEKLFDGHCKLTMIEVFKDNAEPCDSFEDKFV